MGGGGGASPSPLPRSSKFSNNLCKDDSALFSRFTPFYLYFVSFLCWKIYFSSTIFVFKRIKCAREYLRSRELR